MRHVKLFILCLTVALAVFAVAAAAASAEAPIFHFSGETDALSSKGGALTLETTKGETVKCEEMRATSKIEGPSGSNIASAFTPVFKRCTAKILTKTLKCKSPGAGEEEIKGFSLSAKLGWSNKSEKKAGILFSPEEGLAGNPNNLFAEFTCSATGETVEVKVKGSVIALITPIDKSVEPGEHFTIEFEKGTEKGELGKDRKFEGEAENELLMATTLTTKEKPTAPFIKSAAAGEAEISPEVGAQIEAESAKFSIRVNITPLKGNGAKGKFTVRNISGGAATVKDILVRPSTQFTWTPANVTACIRAYPVNNEPCEWEVEYTGTVRESLTFIVEDEIKDLADKTVVGEP